MTELKIGNYTFESEDNYNTFVNAKVTNEEVFATIDTDQDKIISDREMKEADLQSLEIDEDEDLETNESNDTNNNTNTNNGTTGDGSDYRQLVVKQIAALAATLSKVVNSMKNSDSGISDGMITKITNLTNRIQTLQNELTSNTTTTTGTVNGTTNSTGTTVTAGNHNWTFDFEETLSDYNQSELTLIKEKFNKNKDKYLAVEQATGVPAELICAIHYRESGCDFTTYLHNGDPLGQPTTHVPAGIYFEDWTEAAIDALKSVGTNLDGNSLDSCLDYAERYNGLGYRNKGLASPYVWAGTSKYTGGMYVADGEFSATAKDQRVGVAVIMKALST